MKTQIAELITGDFKENTLTLEVNGEMTIKAGKYAIVPFADYEKLVNGETKETQKALAINDVVNSDSDVCPNKKTCKIIMFTADLDMCQRCGKTFEGK